MSDETRQPSPRDLALASVPARLRQPLLTAGGDAGAERDDPIWLVIAHAFRSRSAAESAEASLAEIATALERLPSLFGNGATSALSAAAHEVAQHVGEVIAKPVVAALDRAASAGARQARIRTMAAALLASSTLWVISMLDSGGLTALPLPSRLAAVAGAPAWPLLILQTLAVVVAFHLTRKPK